VSRGTRALPAAETEEGRLAAEQAALRRVATLVARNPPPDGVFQTVIGVSLAVNLVIVLAAGATAAFLVRRGMASGAALPDGDGARRPRGQAPARSLAPFDGVVISG
jgi:hypothetical protein